MKFFGPEHEILRHSVRRFVEREIKPLVARACTCQVAARLRDGEPCIAEVAMCQNTASDAATCACSTSAAARTR
jgi:hypothetical protein